MTKQKNIPRGLATVAARVVADDRRVISYRPALMKVMHSIIDIILLQQIVYRYEQNGQQPFYKFKAPCKHSLYRDGDSWTEETGLTKKQFDAAIARVGVKVKGVEFYQKTCCSLGVVVYTVDMNRLTYWRVNMKVVGMMIFDCYRSDFDLSRKLQKGIYVNPKRESMYIPKGDLAYTKTTTKTTTKNTSPKEEKKPKVDGAADQAPPVSPPQSKFAELELKHRQRVGQGAKILDVDVAAMMAEWFSNESAGITFFAEAMQAAGAKPGQQINPAVIAFPIATKAKQHELKSWREHLAPKAFGFIRAELDRMERIATRKPANRVNKKTTGSPRAQTYNDESFG